MLRLMVVLCAVGGVDIDKADEEDVFNALAPLSQKDTSKSELFVLLTAEARGGKPTVFERRAGSIKKLAQLLLDNGIRGSNLLSKLREIKGNSYLFAGERISEGLIDDLLAILQPAQHEQQQQGQYHTPVLFPSLRYRRPVVCNASCLVLLNFLFVLPFCLEAAPPA